MIEQGLIHPEECRYATAVAEFFSGGSCAPGAKSLKYDPYGDNPDSLCELCMGDVEMKSKCNRTSSERLSGYAGAFRCLATDMGDVAFVKHSTVTTFTDRNSNVEWARGLRSANYVILCRDGGTRNVDEYENCHLAKVPGHAVCTFPHNFYWLLFSHCFQLIHFVSLIQYIIHIHPFPDVNLWLVHWSEGEEIASQS